MVYASSLKAETDRRPQGLVRVPSREVGVLLQRNKVKNIYSIFVNYNGWSLVR